MPHAHTRPTPSRYSLAAHMPPHSHSRRKERLKSLYKAHLPRLNFTQHLFRTFSFALSRSPVFSFTSEFAKRPSKMADHLSTPVVASAGFLSAAVSYSLVALYRRWRAPDKTTILPIHRKTVEKLKVEIKEVPLLEKRSVQYVKPREVLLNPYPTYLDAFPEKPSPEPHTTAPTEFYVPSQVLLESGDFTQDAEPDDAGVEAHQSEQASNIHSVQPSYSSTPTDPFPCTKCPQTFPTRGKLNEHRYRKHDRRFKCGSCEKAFFLKIDCSKHEKAVHTPDGTQRFYCMISGCTSKLATEGTTRDDNVLRHVREVHGG